MSDWNQFEFEAKIVQILSEENAPEGRGHFGRPFITAYQLAVRLHRRFGSELEPLGWPVGGAHTADYHSLARYLADELAKRIVGDKIDNIEPRFLSMKDGANLTYGRGETSITASPHGVLSMYRLL